MSDAKCAGDNVAGGEKIGSNWKLIWILIVSARNLERGRKEERRRERERENESQASQALNGTRHDLERHVA